MLLANQHNEDNQILRNDNGQFHLFQTLKSGDTYHACWIDQNNDGNLDFLTSNAQTGKTQIYRQENQSFIPIENAISELTGFHSGASFIDINNDSYQDVFLTTTGKNQFFKYNSKMGLLVDDNTILGNSKERSDFSTGVSFGDFDNDGDLDAFISNLQNQANSLLENTAGVFKEISFGLAKEEKNSWVGSWGDYDNDGDLDIIISNYDQPISIYENKGGYFKKINNPIENNSASFTSGLAWGDYNKDGFLDLVLANWENQENTFLEGIPNDHNWVVFELEGTTSNRDAIGAKVMLAYGEKDEKVQFRTIQSNMGIRSYPQRMAHFGLGNYKGKVKINIQWPSGQTSNFTIDDLNRYYQIIEGQNEIH